MSAVSVTSFKCTGRNVQVDVLAYCNCAIWPIGRRFPRAGWIWCRSAVIPPRLPEISAQPFLFAGALRAESCTRGSDIRHSDLVKSMIESGTTLTVPSGAPVARLAIVDSRQTDVAGARCRILRRPASASGLPAVADFNVGASDPITEPATRRDRPARAEPRGARFSAKIASARRWVTTWRPGRTA